MSFYDVIQQKWDESFNKEIQGEKEKMQAWKENVMQEVARELQVIRQVWLIFLCSYINIMHIHKLCIR